MWSVNMFTWFNVGIARQNYSAYLYFNKFDFHFNIKRCQAKPLETINSGQALLAIFTVKP